MLWSTYKQNPGLFSRMGAMTHQLTRERFEFRMVLFHSAEHVSYFSTERATAHSNNRIASLPQWISRLSGDSLQTTTTKSIKPLLLIMALSKYLIIIENKLHVAEIILWGIVHLLGFCFWIPELVRQLPKQKILPPGHLVRISYLNAKTAKEGLYLLDLASSGLLYWDVHRVFSFSRLPRELGILKNWAFRQTEIQGSNGYIGIPIRWQWNQLL